MSFSTRKTVIKQDQDASSDINLNSELSLEELEYILGVLRNVDLKGYQVELFYNLIIKIQNQYLQKK